MINWISNYVIEGKTKPSNSFPKKDKKELNLSNFNNDILPLTPQRNSNGFNEFSLPTNSEQLFNKVDDLDFNCFEYYESSRNNGLVCLMYYLFERVDLFEKLKISPKLFVNFVTKIQKG